MYNPYWNFIGLITVLLMTRPNDLPILVISIAYTILSIVNLIAIRYYQFRLTKSLTRDV